MCYTERCRLLCISLCEEKFTKPRIKDCLCEQGVMSHSQVHMSSSACKVNWVNISSSLRRTNRVWWLFSPNDDLSSCTHICNCIIFSIYSVFILQVKTFRSISNAFSEELPYDEESNHIISRSWPQDRHSLRFREKRKLQGYDNLHLDRRQCS